MPDCSHVVWNGVGCDELRVQGALPSNCSSAVSTLFGVEGSSVCLWSIIMLRLRCNMSGAPGTTTSGTSWETPWARLTLDSAAPRLQSLQVTRVLNCKCCRASTTEPKGKLPDCTLQQKPLGSCIHCRWGQRMPDTLAAVPLTDNSSSSIGNRRRGKTWPGRLFSKKPSQHQRSDAGKLGMFPMTFPNLVSDAENRYSHFLALHWHEILFVLVGP